MVITMEAFTTVLTENTAIIEKNIGYGKCFDCKKRELSVAGKKAALYFITSLSDGLLLARLAKDCQAVPETLSALNKTDFFEKAFPYADASLESEPEKVARQILSGDSALVIDGFSSVFVSDTKSLPVRDCEEPDNDRVLRGARDGFTEGLQKNIAILRRRIKTPDLSVYKTSVGNLSKTDIAICYDEKRADPKYVENIKNKIEAISVDALSLGQESLAECLIKRRWYNPFPKFRYTERPDVATATLLEGNIIVLCDTSPQAMMLPTSFFDFVQESDDFYFPPVIGTYLRWVRSIIFLVTLFFSPLWYLMVTHPNLIPSYLDFIRLESEPALPVFIQLMIVELMIDGLRIASLNTPSTLGNSLSVVSGLILGEFAIEVGWFVPEVILYMAFVAISNFTQSSFELGYALKFMRIFLLIMVGLFGIAGFIIGTAVIILTVALNKTVDGSRSYLYPLIPFNKNALLHHLFRVKLKPKDKTADGESNNK